MMAEGTEGEELKTAVSDPPPCAALLKMESAVSVLVSQFKAYAGSDGSSDTLSRDEFHRLVTSQLPNFVKVYAKASENGECVSALCVVLLAHLIPGKHTWC
ncbi:uncharacterized protein LOC119006602 isoform X3 [Acanthopagrus latus]|uniref:uncharacterized protein LOC119006602 isoform X3 n=1 Tax=Acanthopagrus latus TaxID=8177 RepID=UPI00187C5D54|nr:uncharacterized protein LOC119006602 isoform X3 [Acanthopagrus latus]